MSRDAGHEAEMSYLEALSDLFVGFLFIFIIFLMLFALLLAQAQRRTEAVARNLTDAGALRTQMLVEIRDALKRRGISITIDPETGIARLPESLLFASGEAALSDDKKHNLQIVASELANIVPCYARVARRPKTCASSARPILNAMLIEGHTDSDRYPGGDSSGPDLNYDLSAERAIAIFHGLLQSRPGLGAMKNTSSDAQPLLGLSAYGPDRPIVSNATAAGRTKNRRIDLRFIVGTPKAIDLDRARAGEALPL